MPLHGTYVKTKALQDQLGAILVPYWRPTRKYAGFSDPRYYLPTMAEFELVAGLSTVRVDNVTSNAPHFDCDDFAFAFKGRLCLHTNNMIALEASLCVGIAWAEFRWAAGFHACNWVLTSDGTLLWYEPQSGFPRHIYDVDECIKASLRLLIA